MSSLEVVFKLTHYENLKVINIKREAINTLGSLSLVTQLNFASG